VALLANSVIAAAAVRHFYLVLSHSINSSPSVNSLSLDYYFPLHLYIGPEFENPYLVFKKISKNFYPLGNCSLRNARPQRFAKGKLAMSRFFMARTDNFQPRFARYIHFYAL